MACDALVVVLTFRLCRHFTSKLSSTPSAFSYTTCTALNAEPLSHMRHCVTSSRNGHHFFSTKGVRIMVSAEHTAHLMSTFRKSGECALLYVRMLHTCRIVGQHARVHIATIQTIAKHAEVGYVADRHTAAGSVLTAGEEAGGLQLLQALLAHLLLLVSHCPEQYQLQTQALHHFDL